MPEDQLSTEQELKKVKACLAVAWGWMLARGADDCALRAVGYLETTASSTTILLGDLNGTTET